MSDKWRLGSKGILARVPKTPSRRAPLLALPFVVAFLFLLLWSPGIPPDAVQELQDADKLKGNVQTPSNPVPPPHIGYRTVNHDPAIHSDDYNLLINLTDFDFLINHSPCNNSIDLNQQSTRVVLLVLVHSHPANLEKRQVIRKTWGSWANVPSVGAKIYLLFLLGEVSSKSLQERINEEDQRTQDIVQGRFIDSYRNLTYKHVMGLKWSTYFCPQATYVLKTDDDVFVNTPALVNFLTGPRQANRLRPHKSKFILCSRVDEARVKRSYRSKWHVRPVEYPRKVYPSYCLGCVILYSSDVVVQLYQRAQVTPYFWVDDVHVTGTLAAQVNLTQTDLGNLMLKESQELEIISISQDVEKEGRWYNWWSRDENLPWGKGKDPFLFGKEFSTSVIRNLWRVVNGERFYL